MQKPSQQPSDFAQFCARLYTPEHGLLFDIGCGNGRDTFYFSSQALPCCGIDQSETVIQQNQAKRAELGLPARFHAGDFSACDYDALSGGTYSVYSRFTLHAINYDEDARLFEHLNQGRSLKYLFIEARSIRDALYGQGKEVGRHEFVTTHYRRFIDPVELQDKLERTFDILSFEEGQGFARTEMEDPCLIRVVARRCQTATS